MPNLTEDSALIQSAQLLATGSNIHRVASAIALYRNQVYLYNMKGGEVRKAMVNEYERQLRALISASACSSF